MQKKEGKKETKNMKTGELKKVENKKNNHEKKIEKSPESSHKKDNLAQSFKPIRKNRSSPSPSKKRII